MNNDNNRPKSWICKDPDCPHENRKKFNEWVRKNLPSSATGFLASDLDFILFNYKTRNIMLLEIKTRGKELKTWQSILFNNLDKWLKRGIDSDWEYHGFNYITYEKTNFNDGDVFFNGKEITEDELRSILSFEKIGASNG